MNPETACFQNIDPNKNIGKSSGKRFAVFFKKRNGNQTALDAYGIHSDGTTYFIKESSRADVEALKVGVQAGEIVVKKFKDLTW